MASAAITENKKGSVSAETITRFKVSFQNITVRPYSASNPAPIGIRVIGENNFIA